MDRNDRTLSIRGSDWQAILHDVEGDTVGNVEIKREKGQNFHATMVEDSIPRPNGEVAHFRQLMLIEHDQSNDRVGDVVIVFRQDPHSKRYKVQVEEENVFETETDVKKTWKATRSSVDNVIQAVKRTVVQTGWQYTNPRRIGGKRIASHYVIAGWSPDLRDNMMDVYDYVQTLDSLGLAAFLKALQQMPERPAKNIFNQMRTPSINGDSQ